MDKIKYVAFYGEVYLLNYIKIKTTCLKLYILYAKSNIKNVSCNIQVINNICVTKNLSSM